MKKIKQTQPNKLLLIPAKRGFGRRNYPFSHYKGKLCSNDGKEIVHILLFNCSKKEEILSLVDLEIKDLKVYLSENPFVEEVKFQLKFFSKLKDALRSPDLIYNPPDRFIQWVSQKCFPGLKKEKTIFLKGVSYLFE